MLRQTVKSTDIIFMRRAMQLARLGQGAVSPNPMVGAVIVARDRIIGEGFHRCFGGPHAEVNAIRSVSQHDRPLLSEATIYVTLEPCSHYGKTPPCAKLIIDTGIPRVVVGAPDPNPKVNGRGIRMLREAGIEVTEGILARECIELNRRFMISQISGRPYVQLKWAQTADGIMATIPPAPRLLISSPLTMMWMHRQRSLADAIWVGCNTVRLDNPSLTCRLWPGRKPLNVSFLSNSLPADAHFFSFPYELKPSDIPLEDFLQFLFKERGIGSIMVEGGAATLLHFIEAGCVDEFRIEISGQQVAQEHSIVAPYAEATDMARGWEHPAPELSDGRYILTFQRPVGSF